MVVKLFCIVFFVGAIPQKISAQQTTIDSLETILPNLTSGEERINILLKLSSAYLDTNLQTAQAHLTMVLNELKADDAPELWIRYYITNSIYHRINGNPNAGIVSAKEALKRSRTHPDSLYFQAKINTSLGSLYDDKSEAKVALNYHLKALRYAESIGDKHMEAVISNNIGRVYIYLSEYNNAKKYYKLAIAIKEARNEYDQHLAASYTNLSSCLDATGDYEASLEYLDKSIAIKEKLNNIVALISSYNNKAYTLLLMNRLDAAEIAIKKSIYLADSLQIDVEKSYGYSTYAEILFAQNNIALAESYMNKSIKISKLNNDLYLEKYNLDLMYNINLKRGNYKKALEYFKARSTVTDSMYNVKSRSEIEKLSLEYETEKKNREIQLLNAEKDINTLELKKSRQLQIAFLVVALLAFLVILLLRSRHKNKVKTDLLVKEALEKSYEKKLSESELQALRAQMNPHFLFNCLNSINSFIIKNEQEQASEYLSKFSMLIRKVLSNSKLSKVTLANELEALELYIEMEALRCNNKFQHSITIATSVEVDYIEIPPLLIQPYVENSIWHGLMHKNEGVGKLQIEIKQEGTMLICSIEDNGIGRKASAAKNKNATIKRTSFGMNITKKRLEHINERFKEKSHTEIIDLTTSTEEALGTKVIIKIAI